MTIINVQGTTSEYFKIGDVTVFTGISPYAYNKDLGKDGDVFLANDGKRYSKSNGEWQILLTQYTGNSIPSDTFGEDGDFFKLSSDIGVGGIKYVKISNENTNTVDWNLVTKELYANVPNNELYSNLDLYEITDDEKYVKINGEWVKVIKEIKQESLPAQKIGKNGDLYKATSINQYYYKVDGVWYPITTTYYATAENPFIEYGHDNDIWVGENFDKLYVKENNLWVNKSNNNQVFGANNKISSNFISENTIFKSVQKRYYGKFDGKWILSNMFYRQTINPENYLGEDDDICLNTNSGYMFMKHNGIWNEMTLIAKSSDIPVDTFGEDLNLTYIEIIRYETVGEDVVQNTSVYDYLTTPLVKDGLENDIYIIDELNKQYYKYNNNWELATYNKDFNTNPENIDSNILNNYLYVMPTKSFINQNGNWILINNTIDKNTEPSDFIADNHAIYKNENKYFIYEDRWLEAQYFDYTSTPITECGVNYDVYYINSTNQKYVKLNGVWVDISSNIELEGTTEPSLNIGDIGDLYHNTISDIWYVKVEISQWQKVSNIYNANDEIPADSFWIDSSIYKNVNDVYYVKYNGIWNQVSSYYDTTQIPLPSYWNDFDLFVMNNQKYVKYNGAWNLVANELSSEEKPDNHLWEKGTIYNSGSIKYIKISDNNWQEVNKEYNSNTKPDDTFWANYSMYQTSTATYVKNGTWNLVSNIYSNENPPLNEQGLVGDVFITSDFQYYLKLENGWKLIYNVFTSNTAPKYNTFGEELNIYILKNNHKFVKYNNVWNYITTEFDGENEPINDVGEIGTLCTTTNDNIVYVLDFDYNWKQLKTLYTPNDNPLDTDGQYLWIYIKSDTDILYHNGTKWIQVSKITKSHDEPLSTDGTMNDLWILLSSGLYVKNNGVWGKIITTSEVKQDFRQDIYLFT